MYYSELLKLKLYNKPAVAKQTTSTAFAEMTTHAKGDTNDIVGYINIQYIY